eukprot:TRINITY_DN25318_c0_g2_i1.p1 TRINITY_DN25318_c0_g2~~TRINITY_DN25318_c0_g2_i1.p1  ORF type:complete len:361 (-),score=38.83 TRINITY_DN25318_c0_g2_i1:185-1267(-)
MMLPGLTHLLPRQHRTFSRAVPLSLIAADFALPSEQYFWLIGITFTLVGTTIAVLGYSLQKLAHQKRRETATDTPYFMDPSWLLGFGVVLIGNSTSWLVQGFTSQSILAGFNCWNIFVVFGVAPVLFGESVSARQCAGAFLIVSGMSWMVCCGPREWEPETIPKILDDFWNPTFLGILAVTFVIIAFLGVRSVGYNLRLSEYNFVVLAAIFASYGILCSRCTSSLTVTSVETGDSQVCHWEFFVLFLVSIMFGFCQLHFLNMALRVGDAVSVLPTYYATSMMSQVFVIGTFFHEFRDYGTLKLLRYLFGMAVVIIGVFVLCGRQAGDCIDSEMKKLVNSGDNRYQKDNTRLCVEKTAARA